MQCRIDKKSQLTRRRTAIVLVLALVSPVRSSYARQLSRPLADDGSDNEASVERGHPDGGISQVVHERLANGLDVIVASCKGAPLVDLSVVYRVPPVAISMHAPALSRLLTHLLPALGTRHLSAFARSQLLLAADTGFDPPRVNSTRDDLVLSLSLPPEALELALFIEADRMGFAVDALTQPQIDAAAAQMDESKYHESDLLEATLNASVFAPDHPYISNLSPSNSVRFDLVTVKQYMRRYLQAGNATLVIVGDLNPKIVRDAIATTWGRLLGGGRVSREIPEMHPHVQKRFEIRGHHVQQFRLSWQSPAYMTAADARLDVLSEVLARRLLATSDDLCPRAWVKQDSRALGSRFTVGCDSNLGFNGFRWESHVEETLRDLASGAISTAEVQLASDKFRTQLFEQLGSPERLAPILARQLAIGNERPSVEDYAADYVRVTPDDIASVIQRYLQRPADSLVELRPLASATSELRTLANVGAKASPAVLLEVQNIDDPFWLRPPRKVAQDSAKVPKINAERLPGNVVLRHFERYGLPAIQVSLQFILRDGQVDTQLALVALCQLLQRGEKATSRIESFWNEYGVQVNAFAGSNRWGLKVTGPQERVEQTLRVLRDTLSAPSGTDTSLAKARNAAVGQGIGLDARLVDVLEYRVGSALMGQWDTRRLASRRSRVDAVDSKQIAGFWAKYASRAELAVSVIGPCNLAEARRIAAAVVPKSWQHALSGPRSTATRAPRIWVLDSEQSNVADIQVIWPSQETRGNTRVALALASLSKAARALGNVNTARPRNPTTQFELEIRSVVEADVAMLTVNGVEISRLETVLREMEGYFSRLVERPDYPQLARMGTHDLQRGQLMWFASPTRVAHLLDDWALSGSLHWYPIENYENLGLVSRERIAAFAKSLTLDRATIVARGPAWKLESALRNVNHGEWIVIPPEAP